mmetsp:Transcript_20677/g.30446  ORF Transcript_20677/g.30446 Transcript_20677/m.30446 type:complete len:548 (+) Transcript_20677:28-1671(+)
MADVSKNDNDEFTAKLGIMSLLAIFQDILPTYRIRVPSQAEMNVRVSKDTKKMWDYERDLLTHYRLYLQLLEKTWNNGGGKGESSNGGTTPPTGLAVASILCLSELLKSNYHFNFRSNILTVLVRQSNNKRCTKVSQACCDALKHVFATDAQGDVSLEATKLLAKMIKERPNRIRPDVLRTFLSLPLRVHEDEAQAAKLASVANAKKRKKDAEAAEIEDEMKEGESNVDKIALARAQSDTLHSVTLTYFRVLKSEADAKGGRASINPTTDTAVDLLSPALEGLAKFAHLINIDTVVDLLAVLRTLLKERSDTLPIDAALNCILTAFQTLQGPGREMQIDQKEYVTPLYRQLSRLCTDKNSSHTELALKCLSLAFLKRREYSTVRVAAFFKQICTVSLHAPPHTAAPLLAFSRQLVQRYPSVQQLLENEQDVITTGSYTPDVEDPEHSNPHATSAWELSLSKFRIHESVAKQAIGTAEQKIPQLPRESPDRIRATILRDIKEGHIGYRRSMRKHPLSQGGGRGGRDKRNRNNQIRFIAPRNTSQYHLL